MCFYEQHSVHQMVSKYIAHHTLKIESEQTCLAQPKIRSRNFIKTTMTTGNIRSLRWWYCSIIISATIFRVLQGTALCVRNSTLVLPNLLVISNCHRMTYDTITISELVKSYRKESVVFHARIQNTMYLLCGIVGINTSGFWVWVQWNQRLNAGFIRPE